MRPMGQGSGQPLVIVEPPFLEPSLSRPESWSVAAIATACGARAQVQDLNQSLYRALLSGSLVPALSRLGRENASKALAREFFLTPAMAEGLLAGHPVPGGDLPLATGPAVVGGDWRVLDELRCQAIARFAGGSVPPHPQYVRDQQFLNAVLEIQAQDVDPRLHLSLSAFEGPVRTGDVECLLEMLPLPDNPFYRLYDRAWPDLATRVELERVLVVISQEPQVLPGIALAGWLRSRHGASVCVTGDFLDSLLEQYFPPRLAGLVDTILAYRFEFGGPSWLRGESHPFVLRPESGLFPRRSAAAESVRPGPGVLDGPALPEAIGPRPVASLRTTRRCYWARCRFCHAATLDRYRFQRADSGELIASLARLQSGGCRHLQFLDPALPPVLLRAMASPAARGLEWAGQVRFERALDDPDLFKALRAQGCVQLSWGLESASSGLLRNAGKGGELDPAARGRLLRFAADAGITNHVFVMAGLPGETDTDLLATLRFFEQHVRWVHGAEVHAFQLRPGTGFEREAGRHGIMPNRADRPWCSRVSYDGEPSIAVAESRARMLSEALGPLAAASRTNDLLEGHAALLPELWGAA